jgi:CubicO group peptidase (beta-lactamase class C family)
VVEGFVHPAFSGVVSAFSAMFRTPRDGGASLAIHLRGESVVDVWAGWMDPEGRRRWDRGSMALTFSTTKGVASTLLHIVMEREELDYDLPVAALWPEFAEGAKADVRVRELLSHGAGLHRVRGLVRRPDELVDHRHMATLLGTRPADAARRGRGGYHALSYGWLVVGLIEAITGEDIRVTLQRDLAGPLEADGMWFGAPPEERHRVAPLFPQLDFTDRTVERIARMMGAVRPARGLRDAAVLPGFTSLVFGQDGAIHDTVMASVNGVFTARSLSRMYAALANGGQVDGVQLLDGRRVHEIGRVQHRNRDYVLGLPMRWRLGYHQAFVLGRHRPRRAFGHFGAGGSGGWADPDSGLSVGFVTNRMGSATTPVGDLRLVRLGGLAHRGALRAGTSVAAGRS